MAARIQIALAGDSLAIYFQSGIGNGCHIHTEGFQGGIQTQFGALVSQILGGLLFFRRTAGSDIGSFSYDAGNGFLIHSFSFLLLIFPHYIIGF